jgi:regulator of PEP synthase PpsR (kinase-PPPase family)
MKRHVFFVSESTGITAETLGQSLLCQFGGKVNFTTHYMPYINSERRAKRLVKRFEKIIEEEGERPIVFATLVQESVSGVLKTAPCLYLELFDTFLATLSDELGMTPTRQAGLFHGMRDGANYDDRISIINYAMANDDGMRLDKFDEADVILVGVSRSGKTPTCLYLAMHFGLRAANYPITDEDFHRGRLPEGLIKHRHKIVGLLIDAQRLHRIRQERRGGSEYASLERCERELQQAKRMFQTLGISAVDTTTHSIEEVSSQIMRAR